MKIGGVAFLLFSLMTLPVLPHPIQVYPCVGHHVGLSQSRKIKPVVKVVKTKKPVKFFGFGGFWWGLLDSNHWPHACEYSIGEATACFSLRPGLLCPDFVVLGCCPVRCLHTDFSCNGSGCGSAERNDCWLWACCMTGEMYK